MGINTEHIECYCALKILKFVVPHDMKVWIFCISLSKINIRKLKTVKGAKRALRNKPATVGIMMTSTYAAYQKTER